MMKRLTILMLSFLVIFTNTAQDVQFSQYFGSSLYLNPAFAGVFSNPNLSVNYRQQSPGTGVQDQLMQASLIFPIRVGKESGDQLGGVGLTAYNNRQGIQGVRQVSGFMVTYAHNFDLGLVSPDVIIVSAQAGMENLSLSFSELLWGSQSSIYLRSGVDPTAPTPETEFDNRSSTMVLNFGAIYFYNRERNYLLYNYTAYSGISVTNLNRPDKSLNRDGSYRPPILVKYHGGFEYKLGAIYLTPSIMALYFARNFETNTGFLLSYPTNLSRSFSLDSRGLELVMGAWYRLRRSFVFIVGFNNDQLGARLSYDLNSNLFYPANINESDLVNPAFELSIQYNINQSNRLRKVSNPLF